MRARIPTEAGLWPAWWTLGVKGQWPSNGEIDIMEYYQGKVLANVACGTGTAWQAKWDSIATPLSSLGANWAAQFHVWSMDWDQQKIVLAVDGNVLNAEHAIEHAQLGRHEPLQSKGLPAREPRAGWSQRRRPFAHDLPKAVRD